MLIERAIQIFSDQQLSDATLPRKTHLPTVSSTFFGSLSVSPSHYLPDQPPSFIFFDLASNLRPYQIQPEDRIQNLIYPLTSPNTVSISSLNTSPITFPTQIHKFVVADTQIRTMTKPGFEYVDKDFPTQKAVKDKICLDQNDFKSLLAAIHEFIAQNVDECKQIPRSWSKQNWKTLTSRFIDFDKNGAKFWKPARAGFTTSSDLVYPDDKEAYAVVTIFAENKLMNSSVSVSSLSTC